MKNIDIKEFVEQGYLQEANRQWFHPLGLSLEVVTNEDGTMQLSGVRDDREDPAGLSFNIGLCPKEEIADMQRKADNVYKLEKEKVDNRVKLFGHWIEPVR